MGGDKKARSNYPRWKRAKHQSRICKHKHTLVRGKTWTTRTQHTASCLSPVSTVRFIVLSNNFSSFSFCACPLPYLEPRLSLLSLFSFFSFLPPQNSPALKSKRVQVEDPNKPEEKTPLTDPTYHHLLSDSGSSPSNLGT